MRRRLGPVAASCISAAPSVRPRSEQGFRILGTHEEKFWQYRLSIDLWEWGVETVVNSEVPNLVKGRGLLLAIALQALPNP
jgi:hypothetical protein